LTDPVTEREWYGVAFPSSAGNGRAPPAEAKGAAELAGLYREHVAFVWRSLRRLGVRAADADDAVQEVFLVVARRLTAYEERGAMRAWLFRIAQQVAHHARRGQLRRERREREPLAYEGTIATDPQRALEKKESAQLVERLLDLMEPAQSMVLYLADVEGLSAPEIASALAVPLNTVYGRLRLGRARFESLLRQHALRAGGSP
jgi:RNA polymerase sigma-70 factor (ECF subfamily)